jgi:ethanolaminephosphotransferase
MSLKSKYIEDQYKEKLINYKYKGGDNSILCVYIINPFCNFIVEYFPKWLAPNVITCSGFFFNLLNLIITIYYTGWKGGDYIPPWACIACAISYTTYIILDYSDGKQARRLNASSPLGLLFDHGTDSCTTFYISLVTGSITYFNNINQYLIYYIPISCTFFLNTWEEYYVGELVLPIIHGVAEGTLYADIVYIISALYGKSFYLKEITVFNKYKLKYNEINALLIGFGGFLFSIKSFFGVLISMKKRKRIDAIKNTLIYILFATSLLSVVFLNDSIIAREYPKFLILTYGFQFAKILGILQLSHILSSPYNAFRPVFLIPLFSLLIHSIIYYFFNINLIVSIDALIIATFIWNLLSWMHFVYFCSDEICEILNINRFVLGKRYLSKPSYDEIKKNY